MGCQTILTILVLNPDNLKISLEAMVAGAEHIET